MKKGDFAIGLATAAVITLASTSIRSANASTRLDLANCVHIALTNSTQVLKSKNELDLSAEQLLQSYAQFLPAIDASSTATYGWGNQYYTFTSPVLVNSKNLAAQFELSTSLNLFNGLSDIAGFRAALLGQEAANMTLTWAKQQVATDVTQSYYQVMLDRRILEIDEKNLEDMLSREKLLTAEYEVGNASPADAAQQTAQASLASSSVIAARQKLQDDSILLIQKLRLDPAAEYVFEDLDPSVGVPAQLESEEEMTKTALDLRADLKSARSLTQREDEEVGVARGDYFPKLNLGFGLIGSGSTLYSQFVDGASSLPPSQESLFPQLGNQINYAVTLTLSWNILDHGLTRYAVAQARVADENSQIDYEDARIAVLSQVHQVQGDYNAALTALLAARRSTLAAQKAYNVISGRYKVGASSLVDLITAQAALVQAQSTEAQSRIGIGFQAKLVDFYEGKTPIQ